jgi:hypothetical protein
MAAPGFPSRGLGTASQAERLNDTRPFQRIRLAILGSGVGVLVTDAVRTSASAHNTHNFIRTVLKSVIGRKKMKSIAMTRTALITYMGSPSCFVEQDGTAPRLAVWSISQFEASPVCW